jgi:hypothetical protein
MNELDFLKEVFKDQRLHIGIGTIAQTGLSLDKNKLRALVTLLPENRQIWCEVAWSDVLDISFPQVKDLVLVASVDGHPDESFIIKSITNSDEQIPQLAEDGSMVKYARAGKMAFFGSDTKIGLARPDINPSSPLVLGDVVLNALNALANAFLTAPQIGQSSAGPVTLDPSVVESLEEFQETYLTDQATNILSQIAFTERGT